MTDTEERALLERLVEAWRDGGEASHSFEVLTQVLREARALLAEPEGGEPTLRSMAGAAPDLTGGVESVEWLRRKRAAMEDNYAAYATPRSRAEGSDLSVDQGREFRVVDGLGDSNRAGKVTIDPTLLSPPTPRSRAEAEAMVAELFPSLSTGDGIYYITQERAMAPGIADGWPEVIPAPHTPHGRLVRRQFDRAALLAALTGEGT